MATKPLDPTVIAEVHRLLDQGVRQRDIAQQLGVGQGTVSKIKHGGMDVPSDGPPEVEVPVIHRDYTALESLRVYPMGDFHIGSPQHNAGKLDQWLDYIVGCENCSMLNTGDNINAAIVGSKSEVYDDVMTVEDAIATLEDKLRPVAEAGRLDAIGEGNHCSRVYRAVGINPGRVVARHLDVAHWRASAAVIYHVGDQEYTFYIRHGTGNSPASTASVTKSGLIIAADVYVFGHTHRQQVVLEDSFELAPDKKSMRRRPRRFVTAGSYVNYESYAAVRGYAPSHLGAPRVFLDGRRHDVHVSI